MLFGKAIMASLIPNGKQQFFGTDGTPLALGTVTFYVPGTTTLKDTWQDPDKIALNDNPLTLDAAGEAVIYGDGQYRQVLQDSLGNQIWDKTTQGTQSTGVYVGGATGGSANAQTIDDLSPTGYVRTEGNVVTCIAGFTNTGATTLNVEGTGAVNVYKKQDTGAVALSGGEIIAGTCAIFIDDGTQYQLVNSLTGSLPTNLIGRLLSANFNSTADQAIEMFNALEQRFRVTKITVENTSVNGMNTAVGGIYPAASKGGTALVANTQVYTGLTNANTALDLTLATPNAIQPGNTTLYFSLTTPQGAAATADIYVFGDIYT